MRITHLVLVLAPVAAVLSGCTVHSLAHYEPVPVYVPRDHHHYHRGRSHCEPPPVVHTGPSLNFEYHRHR